jgi:cytochrome c553
MCIGCHGIKGYQASFPEIYKVPMISGQGAKYIVAALAAYQKGERKHPTMRGIADHAERPGHGRHCRLLRKQRPQGPASPLPASRRSSPRPGRRAAQEGRLCVLPRRELQQADRSAYPKIAGQHADYLFVALKSYKTEGNATWGRSNGVMAALPSSSAMPSSRLANYMASLPGELQTVPQSKFR